jgi:hypothetical protein
MVAQALQKSSFTNKLLLQRGSKTSSPTFQISTSLSSDLTLENRGKVRALPFIDELLQKMLH